MYKLRPRKAAVAVKSETPVAAPKKRGRKPKTVGFSDQKDGHKSRRDSPHGRSNRHSVSPRSETNRHSLSPARNFNGRNFNRSRDVSYPYGHGYVHNSSGYSGHSGVVGGGYGGFDWRYPTPTPYGFYPPVLPVGYGMPHGMVPGQYGMFGPHSNAKKSRKRSPPIDLNDSSDTKSDDGTDNWSVAVPAKRTNRSKSGKYLHSSLLFGFLLFYFFTGCLFIINCYVYF